MNRYQTRTAREVRILNSRSRRVLRASGAKPVSIQRIRRIVCCLEPALLERGRRPTLSRAECELDAVGLRAQAGLLLELALVLEGLLSLDDWTTRVERELDCARRDLRTVVASLESLGGSGGSGGSGAQMPDTWPEPRDLARAAYALSPRASIRAVLVRCGWWWKN